MCILLDCTGSGLYQEELTKCTHDCDTKLVAAVCVQHPSSTGGGMIILQRNKQAQCACSPCLRQDVVGHGALPKPHYQHVSAYPRILVLQYQVNSSLAPAPSLSCEWPPDKPFKPFTLTSRGTRDGVVCMCHVSCSVSIATQIDLVK